MLNMMTVSFFGHRYIENVAAVEEKVERIVQKLIQRKEYIEFLVGREGEFDRIVASCAKRVKQASGDENSALIWVLPYPKAEYLKNAENLERYYDEIETCDASAAAHPKGAIGIRNRYMIDRSDLIVFCVERENGGAWQAMRYAKRCGKEIINLADMGSDLY